MIIAGIGQKLARPKSSAARAEGESFRLHRRGPNHRATSVPWIYAGGDAAVGPWSVVGPSRMAKKRLWRSTRCSPGPSTPSGVRTSSRTPSLTGRRSVQYPRAKQAILVSWQNNFQEVELSWSEAVARREAKRCLRCDYRAPAGSEGKVPPCKQ